MLTLPISAGLAVLLTAVPTAAQPAAGLRGVNVERLVGRQLRIVDTRGIERFGRLSAVGDGELRLLVPAGEVAVPFSEIQRLDRRDSVGNGLLIGMLWPAVAFALGSGQGYDSEAEAWAALPFSIAVGGAIGAGIDTLNKGWTNVYRADPPPRSAVIVAPTRGGLRLAYTRRF